MKLRTFLITLALGVAGLIDTAVHAQSVDRCSVCPCMAGISGVGATGAPACAPATVFFFSIAIFDPDFDVPATSLARQEYLTTCPGATTATNAAIPSAIMAECGLVP